MLLLRQVTLLATPIEHLPAKEKPGESEAIRKDLADVERLYVRGHDRNVRDILEFLDVSVVLRLLHRQSCRLYGGSVCQCLSQHCLCLLILPRRGEDRRQTKLLMNVSSQQVVEAFLFRL